MKRKFYDETGEVDDMEISSGELRPIPMMAEMMGGDDGQAFVDMVASMSPAELRRMPPFPFPGALPARPPARHEVLVRRSRRAAALDVSRDGGGDEEGDERRVRRHGRRRGGARRTARGAGASAPRARARRRRKAAKTKLGLAVQAGRRGAARLARGRRRLDV